MSNSKKAVFFPRKEGDVKPYIENVDDQLNAGGLATKYSISSGKVTRIGVLKADIPLHLSKAESLRAQAQSEAAIADKLIREANLLNHDIGDTMQKDNAFDISDFELIGYGVTHTPPDPALAKPEISRITRLTDMTVFDWVRGTWAGMVIYASYDGINYTKLDKDTRSPWEDKRKNQAANLPEVRYYKFRYLDKDDKEIGLETKLDVLTAIY